MSQYSAGAVWWALIDFGDGQGKRKKYLILLTDCEAADEQFVVAMATSKGDRRYLASARSPSPCAPNHIFFRIEERQEACFPATTWVPFDNVCYIGKMGLDERTRQEMAGFVQSLSPERTRALLNCAKKSEDIPNRDLARIDRALKARNPSKKTPPSGPTPKAPPAPAVDPALESARALMEQSCGKCRVKLMDEVPEVATVMEGKAKAPDGFLGEFKLWFEIVVSECDTCSKCACPSLH